MNDNDYENIGKLIANSSTRDFIIDKTKKIMWSMVQYKEIQMRYTCALKEMETKFDVLDTEFELQYKRNPIRSISTRLKRADSIIDKLIRLGYAPTLEQNVFLARLVLDRLKMAANVKHTPIGLADYLCTFT